MKKTILFLVSFSVLFLALAPPAGAKRKASASKNVVLKQVEDLFFISQDLEENALILMKPEKGCFCSCRDSAWSCTDVSCEMHYKKCENPPPEQAENQQPAQSTFSWGG